MHILRTRDAPADYRQVLAEAYGLLRPLRAEGLRRGEEVDGFEPVRLALPVLAADDVQPLAPEDFAAQIPEIVSLNGFEQHMSSLTYAARNGGRPITSVG